MNYHNQIKGIKMSIQGNSIQYMNALSCIDTNLNAVKRSDQEKQIVTRLTNSYPETALHTYPLAVIEAIFIECLCTGGTREVQALACLCKSFYENMRMIVCKYETNPLQSIASSKNTLVKVKSIIPDKRADKIFHILNVFLVWSRNVKLSFFLANNPQEAYSMDQKKYFSVVAGDFSSALVFESVASFTLNNLLIGVNNCITYEFPGEKSFSYPPILAHGNSMIPQRDLFDRIEALIDAAGEYVINLVGGCSIIDPDFKIRYKDLKTQQMHTMDILPYTCINYAFYHLHEQRALPIVFENYMFQLSSDIFPFLINVCRYRPVKKAQKGDLICYFDKDKITHWGVMESEDIVHSKWNQLKPAFSHPIKFVPRGYGRKILVLRETSSTKTSKQWEFDSEELGSKCIRGHDTDCYFRLKFKGANAGSNPKTSFSKYMTLCGRSFILYGVQDASNTTATI